MIGSVFDCGACPYLADRHFHVFVPHDDMHEQYRQMMDAGFRRNGDVIYHTHCPNCDACTPTRVDVPLFKARRDQRRCWNQNQDLIFSTGIPSSDQEHQSLFRRYEECVHNNSEADLDHLLNNGGQDCLELRVHDQAQQLVAVSIIDVFDDAISSVYCYFNPDLRKRSLGTLMALHEIEWCKSHNRRWLYLGFYVANCQKLAYKARFQPMEFLHHQQWRSATAEQSAS